MHIILLGKHTLNFVLSTCRKDMYDASLHDLWDRYDAMVLAWIMNTIFKDLINSVIYASNARSIWEDLKEKFDKINVSRAFYLH